MGNAGIVVVWLVMAACGRMGFDPTGARDAADGDGATGDGPMVQSCAGLAATCGPAGTSSCCDSPLVPGGTFFRDHDVGTDGLYPDMTNPATLSDFRLDTYEVTVGRFRQFVSAGMGTQQNPPPSGAGARTLNGMADQGGWDPSWNASLAADTSALVAAVKCNASNATWTDVPGANEALPMNCITWYEAMAFCIWDDGFVPTQAQWNYAAAGGSEQRAYAWSVPASSIAIDCSYTNYYDGTTYCVSPPNGAVNRVGSESPKGDGKWGQADLAGNVYEWALDWYAFPLPTPCDDCAALTGTSERVVRGGSYAHPATDLRGADPFDVACGNSGRVIDIGVRCARAP